jgi:hypothetical protein
MTIAPNTTVDPYAFEDVSDQSIGHQSGRFLARLRQYIGFRLDEAAEIIHACQPPAHFHTARLMMRTGGSEIEWAMIRLDDRSEMKVPLVITGAASGETVIRGWHTVGCRPDDAPQVIEIITFPNWTRD